MNILRFTTNWNNKLDNFSFTTIRLKSDVYQVGSMWIVEYKKQYRPRYVQIIDKKSILLKDINEWMARIDTGYSKPKCEEIIRTMYKNRRSIDWDVQRLDFMLLSYTDKLIQLQPHLFNA